MGLASSHLILGATTSLSSCSLCSSSPSCSCFWRCLKFSSRLECRTFQLCAEMGTHSAKLCRTRETPQCSSWVRLWTRLSLCNDRCGGWSSQCSTRGVAATAVFLTLVDIPAVAQRQILWSANGEKTVVFHKCSSGMVVDVPAFSGVRDEPSMTHSCESSRAEGTLLVQCLVRQWYMLCISSWELLDVFLREGGTRILKSILSCSPEDVAALVVDHGSGMCLLVCWLRYTSCCVSFDCRQAWGV